MIYWFVLGGLFLLGGAYVMLNGAKLVREDNEIQDQLSAHKGINHE
ncbi:hypothetical protein [Paenibacillus sp. ATY16]|nr:hypothetical protein [Paenibacillus sp. ATY16]MCK9859642.1 hypothetical protein [Paenibacillus sp. ATY16]